jgi:gamma-glutamyltranspeptidase
VIFFPDGQPPEVGFRLVQCDLARTLEGLSDEAFRRGPIVDAICDAVSADGGFLEPRDFAEGVVEISPVEQQPFAGAHVFGPSEAVTGTGILFPALAMIDVERLGANRSQSYVDEMSRALRAAWDERTGRAKGDFASSHTTHLCVASGDGSLASLTFTHGRRKFGSGLVAPGTGIVLNAGVGLFSPSASGPRAVTNMAPVVIETADGTRHAFGAVGGPRIPAIVLTSAVDVIHYRHSLADSLSAAHLAVSPIDGALETEANLAPLSRATEWSVLKAGETFGPACGITRPVQGSPIPALDPRFLMGIAEVPAPG